MPRLHDEVESRYIAKNGKAPSDKVAEEVWDNIMRDAVAAGLVVQAYGGVATLAIPREQRIAGIREKVLRMASFELENF